MEATTVFLFPHRLDLIEYFLEAHSAAWRIDTKDDRLDAVVFAELFQDVVDGLGIKDDPFHGDNTDPVFRDEGCFLARHGAHAVDEKEKHGPDQ